MDCVRESCETLSGEKEFQAEGTPSTKTLRQETMYVVMRWKEGQHTVEEETGSKRHWRG